MTERPAKLRVRGLRAWYGAKRALHGIDLDFPANEVTALIGPSGCGKTTFLRCLNRMHEVAPGARVEGSVRLDDAEIYAPSVNPVQLRRRVGMVFQKANPFPTMSILDNVVSGLRLQGLPVPDPERVAEKALTAATLWDEVKGDLRKPGTSLSGGQQQRLCIARALAIEPEVLLMDEPCSALDPIATASVEALIRSLSDRYTIVVVTHNLQQAGRISDRTAFFYEGELVETGDTEEMFIRPRNARTSDYLTGRFG